MKRLLTVLAILGITNAAILGITNAAFATTPTIGSVSGTVSTGQTLTISGSNMVQEVTSGWGSNWTGGKGGFEGSSPSADGFLNMGASGGYDNSVKLMGNQSIKFHAAGTSDGTPAQNMFSYNYTNESNQSDYWIRGYVRYNSASNLWSWGHIKMYDLQSSSGSVPNTYLQWASGTTLPSSLLLVYDAGSSYSASLPGGTTLQNNRWYLFEAHIQPTAVTVWWDNQQVYTHAKQSNSLGYFNFGLVNLSGTDAGFSLDHWMDGVAISSSRVYAASTIEISNSATYGAGTKVYQEPVYLSDGSIQFKANLAGLGSGPYYLFVTNNGQTTSSAYSLSGGGVGGGATPVNGACGSASGQSFSSLTSGSSNLCSTGTVASFAGSGPWSWGCSGSGGGTSTSANSCSAALTSSGSNPPPAGGSLLFSESFENNSYSSRGWYDNTNHGTIVSGGQSGNCLQWSWASGATTPTNGASMRMEFTPTDSLYLSYYVKFQTGWQGSQKAYHPHMIYILSDLDDAANAYSPLANNYLDTYVEFLSDVGSPYTIRPSIALQDEKRTNTSNGTPPNNLTAVTENRSVAYCNTPIPSGAFGGSCYADTTYYSANTWKATTASISTNAWHHVEVYLKMNSISGSKGQSDGIMQEWIDGAQVINKNNVLYRTNQDATKKWAQFVLAPYIGDGSPIAQSMWIDELSLSTAMPGGSSVTAPKNLILKSVSPN